MTREEIISGLKFTIEMFLFDPSTGETYTKPRNDMDKTTIDACKGAIELLEREPKTGHWIEEFVDTEGEVRFTCSCCGKYQLFGTDFCYNCGAKMEEVEE